MSKTIEEQVEELWELMPDDVARGRNETMYATQIEPKIRKALQERDRIAFERGVEDTKIKNDETIKYYQLRAREEELEDIGNYVDGLYQTGNMDKAQSEMVCEYIDEKLSTLTK